jgi:hypothetical protein
MSAHHNTTPLMHAPKCHHDKLFGSRELGVIESFRVVVLANS